MMMLLLVNLIVFSLSVLLCSGQQFKMNTIDEGTDKVGIFDHDSPMGRRGVGRKDIRQHIETMKYHRAGPRNTKGHRILETHENGSYTLEIDHMGIKRQLTSNTISSTITLDSSLTLMYDPPNGTFSPKALALYVQASDPTAKVYYAFENVITLAAEQPTLEDSYADYDHPYIHLGLRFLAKRIRRCTIVAVSADEQTRSEQYELHFIVEADARPGSFGFLTPGTETDGYFVKISLEMAAAARAQVAGGQELADFYTDLGVGTYVGQVTPLKLNLIHDDLKAFEGGMAVNCSGSNDNEPFKHWGILPPWHSGEKFTGKVVRVDLVRMTDNETCIADYRHEYYNNNGDLVVEGPGNNTACVTIIDLPSLHANARGFRRGFVQFPYVYLSPGEFNVPVRLDACNMSLATTTYIDLGTVNRSLGGYSGGFQDGDWSCFNPFRTYVGPFGGLRSTDEVDNYQLRPYYHSYLLCVHAWAWTANKNESIANATRVVDLEDVDPELRGFSEALRVGRYAYLTPLAERPHSYTSKVIRINLGTVDIGHMLDYLDDNNMKVREIVDVLNLKLIDESLKGFSGMFQTGKFLLLVPFRNANELYNGQRGHGTVVRIDMNYFDVATTTLLPMPTTIRSQIPSFADEDLRGFSSGFASGKYGVCVPFYNAIFTGKLARFIAISNSMTGNLQELNLKMDRAVPESFRGFRGGFVGLWQGATDDSESAASDLTGDF